MKTIVIYGASDDLVEVECSDRKLSDEFSGGSDKGEYVVVRTELSDHDMGSVLDVFKVHYGKDSRAVWNVEHETVSGHLKVEIVRAPPGDDPEPYTDKATVTGNIVSVDCWPNWPPTERDRLERWERVYEDLSKEEKLAALQAVLTLRGIIS